MNDLPENELFSAYLDGELTHGRASGGWRRFWPPSPAARQLLDELSAYEQYDSGAAAKAWKDLAQGVGAAQERKAADKPVPLMRSLSRRFLTRRTLVWLSLTAAIAVMIKIDEWRQPTRPGPDAGREVALAPAKPDAASHRTAEPPSGRARDDDGPSLWSGEALARKQRAAKAPPAAQRTGCCSRDLPCHEAGGATSASNG